jgi:hypothetical protein
LAIGEFSIVLSLRRTLAIVNDCLLCAIAKT